MTASTSNTAWPDETRPAGSAGRPVLISAVVAIAVVVIGVGAWWTTGVFVDGDGLAEPPSNFFDDNIDALERVRALIESGDLPVDGYYGPELPDDLQHLSATDKVSIYDDGSFFIPRWTGIPDDAGGIWWSRTSPEFRDMYGMACVNPADLAGDWWLCG